MIETIGKVKLNYEFYDGVDSYSDGNIEEELLRIVEENDRTDFNKIIAQRKDWTILYHLSHIRANVVSALDISKNDTILEIGAGCGAITGELSKKGKSVTCIELSKRRSLINANQNKACDNVEIMVGNFQTIEPHLEKKYDVITLIGVFEYANLYIQGKDSYYEFINIVGRHLAPGGRVIIAIENKFGMKYWAGCQEDHLGGHFTGIEGYQEDKNGIKTFSRRELQSIFERAGFLYQEFYYPYPDYKLPVAIFSDKYLPKATELNQNMRNFDNERLVLFDENNVYAEILKEEMYSFFANSYIAIISKEDRDYQENLLFAKFSNDLNKSFSVKTEILEKNGNRVVRKAPMNKESVSHVNEFAKNKNKLKDVYANTKIIPIECNMNEETACFEYIAGETLQEQLESYADENNTEKVNDAIKLLFEECRKVATKAYQETEQFCEIFGNVKLGEGLLTTDFSNVGMKFSNIKKQDDHWMMMNYEWCYEIPIPVDYVLYRMLYHYVETSKNKKFLLENNVFSLLGESEKYISEFEKMNENLDRYMMGNHASIESLYEGIGRATQRVLECVEDMPRTFAKRRIRVYMDYGTGYTDDISYWMNIEKINGVYDINIPIDPEMKQIRIDPAEEPCIVNIKSIMVKKNDGSQTEVTPELFVNAEKREDDTYLFVTYDPWIMILLDLRDVCEVNIKFDTEILSGLKRQDANLQFIQKGELIRQSVEIESLKKEIENYKHANYLMKNSLSWRLTKPLRDIKRIIKKQ